MILDVIQIWKHISQYVLSLPIYSRDSERSTLRLVPLHTRLIEKVNSNKTIKKEFFFSQTYLLSFPKVK